MTSRIAGSLAVWRRTALALKGRLVVAGLAVSLAACSLPPVEPPPVSGLPRVVGRTQKGPVYSRAVQLAPDAFAMQTGSRIFRRAGSPDIDLVGVMHVAEEDYYSRIQARLGKADVVLYEGVGGEDGKGNDEGSANPTFDRFASSLGLVVQDIDYSPKSFRNCDLTMKELEGLLDEEIRRGGPDAEVAKKGRKELDGMGKLLDGKLWSINMALRLVSWSPLMQAHSRLLIVGMDNESNDEADMSERLKKLIVDDRNAHVVAELKKLLARERGHRRIAIFYGADHMPDLERSLRGMGYVPKGAMTWESGVHAHPYAAGFSEDDVKEALGG